MYYAYLLLRDLMNYFENMKIGKEKEKVNLE